MPTSGPERVTELAAAFVASHDDDLRQRRANADRRRAIVTELLTELTPAEVADLLDITTARVGQIVGGVKAVRARPRAGQRAPGPRESAVSGA